MAVTLRNRKRIQQLHALLGSQHDGERDTARKKLLELLQKLRLSWNDLPWLLTADSSPSSNDDADDADDDQPLDSSDGVVPNALELVHHMLLEFVSLRSPAEYVAVALWILHTYVFDRFMISPRLAIRSPVRECGKTTLLVLIERLSARPMRTDNTTAAVIYHMIDLQPYTILIDEGDNLDLKTNGALRAALNSGHLKGSGVTRMVDGKPRRLATFSPLAVAAIGSLPLPLPLLSRSIKIDMQRSDGVNNLRRLDDANATGDLDLAYRHAFMWARAAQLNPDPEMPAGIRNRAADNWRVLVAIGDSFGPNWGAAARDAAVALLHGDSDEDIGVMLLSDIRNIFDDLGLDRIHSHELLRHLVDLEDAGWGEFYGLKGNQAPRALSGAQLKSILKPLKIQTRSIWPVGPRDGSKSRKSRKGYLRIQFEIRLGQVPSKKRHNGTTQQYPTLTRRLAGTRAGTAPAHDGARGVMEKYTTVTPRLP